MLFVPDYTYSMMFSEGQPGAPGLGEIRENIMVVAEDECALAVFHHSLDEHGYNVDGWTSSMQSLRVFRNDPYGVDLAIIDSGMPDLPGLDLAESMLQIRPGLPIILCAGALGARMKNDFLRKGIRGFISKPPSAGELLTVVRNTLHPLEEC